MAARDQQKKIGEFDTISQPGGQRVTFEVVDRDKGLSGTPGNPLPHHGADNQTADKTGARGSSYSVEFGQRDVGVGERSVDHDIEMIEMCPSGNLGYDPAKRRVFGELRSQLIG